MISVKQLERCVAPLTTVLCLFSLIGFWTLMTAPNHLSRSAQHQLMQQLPQVGTLARASAPHQPLSIAPKRTAAKKQSTPLPSWVPTGDDLKVEPALLLAIIKQESNFNPKARSHAGATGLMQIMPATAEYIIKLYRLNEIEIAALEMPKLPKPISSSRLHNPQVNLTIGQHYLQYLSEKSYIEGNLIYILTAYNAGPGNLIQWQKRFDNVKDPREFMRRIPFKETRDYVNKVMRNYIAYQKRLNGGVSQAEEALKRGVWPTLVSPNA